MVVQPPKPRSKTMRLTGSSPAVGSLDRLLKRAESQGSFGPEDLAGVAALLRGRINDKQREEIEALLEHPKAKQIFTGNTRDELRALVASLADPAAAPGATAASGPRRAPVSK